MGKIELYDYQIKLAEAIQTGKSIILQAPTGAGKTLAALYPFLEAWDADSPDFPHKCIYAVPMRVLANQFVDEYGKMAARMSTVHPPKVAIQTGENPKDPEFRQNLTFATIDQVLSSWLFHPYSQSRQKANLNAGALVGSYLIFDEFHLFDPDSTLPTTLHMLKVLSTVSPFVLMTATFSAQMLDALAKELNAVPVLLKTEDLQDIATQKKIRRFHTMPQPLVSADHVFVEHIVIKHLAQPSHQQRTLVVCNQVERAQNVYITLCHELEQKGIKNVEVRLLHSRFLQKDRQDCEAWVQREFGKNETKKHTASSAILIGTQVVEVGLDMSCRALHTELAPASAILQRAGRCARYKDEEGDVYVYPIADEKYAPYHGKLATRQCELTWEWLTREANQNRHLIFADEQELINYVHTPADKLILEGLQGASSQHKEAIHKLWRGEGKRGDANKLIRDIQAVSIVIHSQPDKLCHAPFKADSFSIHPFTLMSKYKLWQEENDTRDPDWGEGHLTWLAQYLKEDEDEEDTQANRPIRYYFAPVIDASQLHAPLIALNPALVGYSPEIGLTLYPSKLYECEIPPQPSQLARQRYGLKFETYERHIELVYRAYEKDWAKQINRVGHRLEQRFGWHEGSVEQMARLVVGLHDVGKLSKGWQSWARIWQASQEVDNPMSHEVAAAHTDFDPTNPHIEVLDKKLKNKRPHHAIESALAVWRILLKALPNNQHTPLYRAAFTAIARHHGAFSHTAQSYQLVTNSFKHVQNALVSDLQPFIQSGLLYEQFEHTSREQKGVDKKMIDVNEPADVLAYMIFVRALRFSDQKGTQEGSR